MRMLMKVQMGSAMNQLIENGEMQEFMESALNRIHPEAAYFTTEEGKRTAFFVFDLKQPSDLPAIAEPFFETNALVHCSPVMTADELKAGLKRVESGKLATSHR